MKTIDEVKQDLINKGIWSKEDADWIVYHTTDFCKMLADGSIIPYDGMGRFHDGENETRISIFSKEVSFYDALVKYPYICWYNK